MLVCDHRMVEGRPLQYYSPYRPQIVTFPYFKRFDIHSPEMNEEVPLSPNSTQSDSDNSVSSIEVSPREIDHDAKLQNSPAKCCWHSCGLIFESLAQLATHVTRVHAASGPGGLFYCGWEGCTRNNRGFNARYKMLVHVRTHTNEKPHRCDQCSKSFSRAENLKIHSRSHSGEKPYACPVPGCGKAYSNSSDRFKHARTHQVDKPYKCKVAGCPKRYTDPSSLRKHVKTYKHFVGEQEKREEERKVEEERREERMKEEYRCTRSCCVAGDLTTAATKMLHLEAFLNFRGDVIKSGFLGSFSEEKSAFRPYEICAEQMEVDVPLDLSLGRRRFS